MSKQDIGKDIAEIALRARARNQGMKPDWLKVARPEQLRPPGEDTFIIRGGRGCVAADTMIWNPVTKTHQRIDSIKGHHYVMTTHGIALADEPFLKGVAQLWTLRFEGGFSVTVTDEHRLLTLDGWKHCGELPVGDYVLSNPFHPDGTHQDAPSWARLLSREDAGIGEYWDMHVPGPENYVAQGLYHHNSGKTRSGAEDVLLRARSGEVPIIHVLTPTTRDLAQVAFGGPSGIEACAQPSEIASHNHTDHIIKMSNGVEIHGFSAESPDRLNGPQCLVAGTPVWAVVDGRAVEVPIEQLKVGDLVVTRKGPERIYRVSSRKAEVGRISFANGTNLVGTGDHLLYTEYGWTRFDSLHAGDWVCAIRVLNGVGMCGISMETGTTEGRAKKAESESPFCFIEPSGNQRMARLRQECTFTTSTKTRRTTISRTFKLSPYPSTYESTESGGHTDSPSASMKSRSFHALTAASRSKGERSQERRDAQVVTRNAPKSDGNAQRSAGNVEALSCLGLETFAVSVASTWQPLGEQSVYCISVENAPEYFSHSILSHNCGHLWVDEFWAINPRVIDQAIIGCRIGKRTTKCFTSTPKMSKGTKYVLNLGGYISRLTLSDNKANLAEGYYDEMLSLYRGTALEKVELDGELLENVDGALWKRSMFEDDTFRVAPAFVKEKNKPPLFVPPVPLAKIVVAIDPSVTDPERAKDPYKKPDACGIVVAGVGHDARGYVLYDATAVASPEQWARAAVNLYTFCGANSIIAEKNQGGELIREVIRSIAHIPIQLVSASAGKRARAEPVSMLYEQCIGADSEVATLLGPKAIQDVTTEDMVLTRKGYRRVLWAGQTGVRDTISINAGGRELLCTEDHKIYTQRGWIRARDLVPKSDILTSCTQNHALTVGPQPQARVQDVDRAGLFNDGPRDPHSGSIENLVGSNSIPTAKATGDHPDTKETSSCIEQCGSRFMEKSRAGCTSTTSTETRQTTESKTCCVYRQQTMPESIQEFDTHKKFSTESGEKTGNTGQTESPRCIAAMSAGLNSGLAVNTRGSVNQNAGTHIIVEQLSRGPRLPVYDICVEEEHEFFANGILVHNCRVSHAGTFPDLEEEMVTWDALDPKQRSPNRIDALVWAFHGLGLCNATGSRVLRGPVSYGANW